MSDASDTDEESCNEATEDPRAAIARLYDEETQIRARLEGELQRIGFERLMLEALVVEARTNTEEAHTVRIKVEPTDYAPISPMSGGSSRNIRQDHSSDASTNPGNGHRRQYYTLQRSGIVVMSDAGTQTDLPDPLVARKRKRKAMASESSDLRRSWDIFERLERERRGPHLDQVDLPATIVRETRRDGETKGLQKILELLDWKNPGDNSYVRAALDASTGSATRYLSGFLRAIARNGFIRHYTTEQEFAAVQPKDFEVVGIGISRLQGRSISNEESDVFTVSTHGSEAQGYQNHQFPGPDVREDDLEEATKMYNACRNIGMPPCRLRVDGVQAMFLEYDPEVPLYGVEQAAAQVSP
ncbi:hypothetical protein LTR56_020418 [Elasticomyces elasticus]|nr:hypothetical protein LTR56_020418 [Elasticomyces elasticus]KAK3666493.1 hypothetical protein LTR22_002798 [Elasticomyces elasticus]KAK4931313.1 hypothetical protein LTR49_002371 [Elasticomyces elasticus]KAK5767756.1 hypothetical protein LTS12_001908 [Elasticomyces elasticus]